MIVQRAILVFKNSTQKKKKNKREKKLDLKMMMRRVREIAKEPSSLTTVPSFPVISANLTAPANNCRVHNIRNYTFHCSQNTPTDSSCNKPNHISIHASTSRTNNTGHTQASRCSYPTAKTERQRHHETRSMQYQL